MYILNLSIKKLARQRHSIKKYYLSTTKPILYNYTIWCTKRIYNMLVPYLSKRTTSHTIPNNTQPLHYLPPNE